MAYSMTGFGCAEAADELGRKVEAKSVNHRYLDIHIRLPGIIQRWKSRCASSSSRNSAGTRRNYCKYRGIKRTG